MNTSDWLHTAGYILNVIILFSSIYYLVDWFNHKNQIGHIKNRKLSAFYIFLFISSLVWFIKDVFTR